jgi:hypothetical protein
MSAPREYYQPYDSDGTDGTDGTDISDADSNLSDSEDPRIRREQDPRYMILQAPSMNLRAKQLSQNNPMSQYATYYNQTNITSYKDVTYLNPVKTTKTSLFCLRSDSRDMSIYPSPLNFKIKLPRVYKNVTKVQFVQIAFPNNTGDITAGTAFTNAFIRILKKKYVPTCCFDYCILTTCASSETNTMAMIEQGRFNSSNQPFAVTVSIPDGNYTQPERLGSELTYQANSTPPFNLISYDTFRDIFMNTRDISVLFNEPGDCFTSRVNNKRYCAHTKENIMNTYYTQQHIDSFSEITEVIAFNAYYYPVLKELIATQRAEGFIDTGQLSFPIVKVIVLQSFEGLQSDLYYNLCQLNQSLLDVFRKTLTFELRNINKYEWIYNDKARQFTTIHDTLHTSLQNDIQKQYQTIFNYELSIRGLHANSFKTLKSNLLEYKCIYKHLETNMSTVLGNYHFVAGYQYQGGNRYSTTNSTFYTMNELHEDPDFTSMFCYKSTIGRIYGNYVGTPMNFSSFADYHSTLSSYYTIINSTNQTISSIHGTIIERHHEYVFNKYNTILPQSMLSNKSYMTNTGVPVRFLTNQKVYVPGQPILVPRPTANTYRPNEPNSSNAARAARTTYQVPSTVPTTSVTVPSSLSTMSFQLISSTNQATVNQPTDNTTIQLQSPIIMATSTITSTVACPTSTCNCFDSKPGTPCCVFCGPNIISTCGCFDACCAVIQDEITRWYSCLPTNTVINSLFYKTGVISINQGDYNFASTINTVLPPTNNNLFISINDEMGFNNLDVAMPENYSETSDPTGQVKLMFAKMMFAGVGKSQESQTLYQNPKVFSPALAKLDHFTFKIYNDDAGLTPLWLSSPFPQVETEWNGTLQIEEEVAETGEGWSSNPTLPIPTDPNATPYLGFTSRDNPHNQPRDNPNNQR